MSRTIALAGMMGAGKTTVGRALADRLGRGFVDTDAEIERVTGTTVACLFDERGEAGFRALEKAVVAAVAALDDVVVALGGGAVLDDDNVAHLLLSGVIVHLDVPVATLVRRLVADGPDARPLLDGGVGHVERLHAARRPRYLEVADVTVDAGRAIEQVVEDVVEWSRACTDVLTPSELEQLL